MRVRKAVLLRLARWGVGIALSAVSVVSVAVVSFDLPPLADEVTAEHHPGKVAWTDLVTPDLDGAIRERRPFSAVPE